MRPHLPFLALRHGEIPPEANFSIAAAPQCCNHPLLCYHNMTWTGEELLQHCGKMCVLDRLLVKLYYTG